MPGSKRRGRRTAPGAEKPKRKRVAKRNLGNRPRVACPGMAAGVAESDPASCRSFRDPQDHLHHHAMESRNRVILKSIKTRGAFRAGEAATRLICLAIRNVEKAGRNVREWFGARNQLAILFEDRFKA